MSRTAWWAVAWALLASPAVPAMNARATRVSDGDTLWVRPADGGAYLKLRLKGIDAPEICQAGGVAARDALRDAVAGVLLEVEPLGRDAWGRALARVRVQGADLGARLVRDGQAWSDRFQGDPGPYAAEEAAARAARVGLHAQAGAQRPRDFRQHHGPCEPAPVTVPPATSR